MKYRREWTAGVAGLFTGAVAGWVATTLGEWDVATEAAHWWDVLGAVATFLAVAVALGISWFTHRVERTAKEREGRIVAAQLSTSLPPLIYRLDEALEHFKLARNGNHDGSWAQAGCVEAGFSVLRGVGDLLPPADLAALAWADAQAADEIAKALGSIRFILAHPLGPLDEDDDSDGVDPRDYYSVASHCAAARSWLGRARRRCGKLSVVKYRIGDEWRLPENLTSR